MKDAVMNLSFATVAGNQAVAALNWPKPWVCLYRQARVDRNAWTTSEDMVRTALQSQEIKSWPAAAKHCAKESASRDTPRLSVDDRKIDDRLNSLSSETTTLPSVRL